MYLNLLFWLYIFCFLSAEDVPANVLLIRDFTINLIEVLWDNIDGVTDYTTRIYPTSSAPTSTRNFVPADANAAFNDYTFMNLECGRQYTVEVQSVGPNSVTLQNQQRTG